MPAQYAHRLTRQDDLPEPFGRVTAGVIYRTEDIERWIAEHYPEKKSGR